MIVFRVGPYRLAIPAAALKEIRDGSGLGAEEFGCAEIVPMYAWFGLALAEQGHLLLLREEPVALRVDQVEQMVEIHSVLPLPQIFQGVERHWFRGLALVSGTVVPILDPAGFLGAASQLASAGTQWSKTIGRQKEALLA